MSLTASSLSASAGAGGAGVHGSPSDNLTEFPTAGIMPKEETRAAEFVAAAPECDGRGVIVAIFDTGVDPNTEGLRVTSDGKPKIVDVIDATGGGDVDTSTVRKLAEGETTIVGLSGRTLTLPSVACPSGEYHVGLKKAYELFPGGLVTRMKKERKEEFAATHAELEASLLADLAAFNEAHPKPTGEDVGRKADFEARLAEARALMSAYDDEGPVYDVVAFNDGTVWRVAVDLSETGDLSSAPCLAPFNVEYESAVFSEKDLMNYSVNVHEEGNVVSLVTTAGSHGTHVAGIVAANYPNQPELNGIAPGAQIVSVKIGDSRLGSMETGCGLARGLTAAINAGCHVINMSYGEDAAWANNGYFDELAREAVHDHGIVFVSSAGNAGPALTTAGAPGSTSECMIGVGAYVTPSMMDVEYSMRSAVPPIPYTWTSRGPAVDGSVGPCIAAPGGAIAPIPTWTLKKSTLMNGTSMASPSAAGAVALMLSAAEAEGRDYTPAYVKRALENTAAPIEGASPFAVGAGVIDVVNAVEWMRAFPLETNTNESVRYEVAIASRGGARGVYIREPYETSKPFEGSVTITPKFHPNAPNTAKVALEKRLAFRCAADWVEVATSMVLTGSSNSFSLRVNAHTLQPRADAVYLSFVDVFDVGQPDAGPLVRIPITVVKPYDTVAAVAAGLSTRAWHYDFAATPFAPGLVQRRFVAVPEGANTLDITLRGVAVDTERMYVLHTLQLLPNQSYSETEMQKWVRLREGSVVRYTRPVVSGGTVEICVAQYWSSLGESTLEVDAEFRALSVDLTSVFVDGHVGGEEVAVTSYLRREGCEPKAQLKKLVRSVRPTSSVLTPLADARNTVPGVSESKPDRRVHGLTLNYSFSLTEDTTVELSPGAHDLGRFLYEGPVEAPVWGVFNDRGEPVHWSGSHSNSAKKLDKGSYTVRVYVRSHDTAALRKLEDTALALTLTLASPVTVPIYTNYSNAITDGAKATKTYLSPGESTRFVVGVPPASSWPAGAVAGDVLTGELKIYAKDDNSDAPEAKPLPLSVVLPPKPAPAPTPAAVDTTALDTRTVTEKLAATLLKERLSFIEKALGSPETADEAAQLLAATKADNPEDLSVLLACLKHAKKQHETSNDPTEVLAVAGEIVALIDATALAAHFGVNTDTNDPVSVKEREEATERKNALIEALHASAEVAGDEGDEFASAFAELKKWVNMEDEAYAALAVREFRRKGQLGSALALVSKRVKAAEASKEKTWKDLHASLVAELGWGLWADYLGNWAVAHTAGLKVLM